MLRRAGRERAADLSEPRRFNELLAGITGVSDRILSERLRELESIGIVRRNVATGPPVRVSYELTCSGHELEPVVAALEAWAEKWITLEPATEKAAS